MRFYLNKTTNEIIGINSMLELIKDATPLSIKLGYYRYSRETIYQAIYPNKLLGNGILSYAITSQFLKDNYKRISKKVAFAKYPIFEQYRHKNMLIESKKLGIGGIDVLMKQTI